MNKAGFFGLAQMGLADWSRLLRPRLLLMVAASTMVGGLLAPRLVGLQVLAIGTLGVLLLSSCATILNQVQERSRDRLMLRTAARPLATGRLLPGPAMGLAALFGSSGLLILWLCDWRAACAGIVALVWYNLLYTPLKPRTPLAVLPGAVSGALPPLIGWLVAGAELFDFDILLLVGLLGLWQVPHFLLLVERYQDDYRRADLPVLADQLGHAGLSRVILCWTLGTVVLALGIVFFGPLQGLLAKLLLPSVASWLLFGLLRSRVRGEAAPLFLRINLFLGVVLLCIALERLNLS